MAATDLLDFFHCRSYTGSVSNLKFSFIFIRINEVSYNLIPDEIHILVNNSIGISINILLLLPNPGLSVTNGCTTLITLMNGI